MRISIVTTALNAMPYISETVRSVLQTPHRELEYLIVDGGSSDGTREFLEDLHDDRLHVEVAAGSRQYEALDWGLRHTNGEVIAWINADDIYLPWTISCVAQIFTQFPKTNWITGLPAFLDGDGRCTVLSKPSSYPRRYIRNGWFSEFGYGNLVQESMFWRRDLYTRAGRLNLNYNLAADFELWTRFAQYTALEAVDVPLAAWRKHAKNRSVLQGQAYRNDVASISSQLPQMNPIKAWLCQRTTCKHALRLAEWHRTPWIYYSLTESRWRRSTALRPISRYSLQYLKREFEAARSKPGDTACSPECQSL